MPRRLVLRPLTDEEATTIHRLAHARTIPQRQWQRARIIWLAHTGDEVAVIASTLRLCQATVRHWLKRFNAAGISGLEDTPRSGAPPTYSPAQIGTVIALSLTDPQTLGQPFGAWTLDRLVVYLRDECGIPMKRSRLSEVLIAEGLRWRSAETWFSERVDPEFAAKRGRSSDYASIRPQEA